MKNMLNPIRLLLALACLSIAVSCSGPPSQGEPALHVGDWQAVSAILAGDPFPEEVLKTITLELTADTYVTQVGGQLDKGAAVFEYGEEACRVTITGTDGPNKGNTILAIATFPSDDEMKICYSLTGQEFPTEWEATKENGLYMAVYQRVKE
ncbi:MAG: hypothetical protein AAF226_01415 [Verrucomicrobiota bacterium]